MEKEEVADSERKKEKRSVKKKDREEMQDRELRLNRGAKIGKWFQMICFMNIPVLGFIYMLVKLIRKKTPGEQRAFAAAYLIYRILVLLLAVTVLYILYQVGLDFVDTILKYADRMN